MSSTVASLGRLIVLEAPPERNGWTAPSILRCPIGGDCALAAQRSERAVEDG